MNCGELWIPRKCMFCAPPSDHLVRTELDVVKIDLVICRAAVLHIYQGLFKVHIKGRSSMHIVRHIDVGRYFVIPRQDGYMVQSE